MLAWIVTSFYVFGVLAAVDSIMNTRTATGAIAWSVSLATVPFIAPGWSFARVGGRHKQGEQCPAHRARQSVMGDSPCGYLY